VETLARHHGLQGLYDLARNNPTTCSPGNLEEALAEMGVRFRIQYPGERDPAILCYAIPERLGAVIGFHQPFSRTIGHIVTLVDITETAVKIIDSNDANLPTRQMSLNQFLAAWDGFALVLEPDSSSVQLPATSRPYRASGGDRLLDRAPRGLWGSADRSRRAGPIMVPVQGGVAFLDRRLRPPLGLGKVAV
jgi:hypothetical protein